MTINLNVPIKLLIRLVRVLERIANNYELVHAEAIAAAKYDYHTGEKEYGKTFYQDDKEIVKAELQRKIKELAEAGMLES